MNSIEITDFLLKETLESGQFFNFYYDDEWYHIVNGNNYFKVKQIKNKLYYKDCLEEELREFFGLNFNLSLLENVEDKLFQESFQKYRGLRIMKCDLFQTIISFICSANANQKKIEKNISLISKIFGKQISKNICLFPEPKDINNLEKLLECSVGYRAKFILKTSQIIAENPEILEDIQNYNYKQAHEFLMTFPGIGSKVADCICLFALNHFKAFPVDTWIKKILNEKYEIVGSQKTLESEGRKLFGDLGGYYQQYIFHHIRKDTKNLK